MTDRLAEIERRLRQLEDERDIARLIASYGPLVDVGEADRVSALWTADGLYDTGDWEMNGRNDVADMVRSDAHQGMISRGSCHFFGPPVVNVDGDTAVAVCQSALMMRRDSGGYVVLRAGVHLLRLRRDGRTWRITSRTARQLDGTDAARGLVADGLAQ